MKPPFQDYEEKMADATHTLVDAAEFASLTSKERVTRLKAERDHVVRQDGGLNQRELLTTNQATTERTLGLALLIEQATLGPQKICIGKGQGDSRDVDFALVPTMTRRAPGFSGAPTPYPVGLRVHMRRQNQEYRLDDDPVARAAVEDCPGRTTRKADAFPAPN